MNRRVRVFRPITSATAGELAPFRAANAQFPDKEIFHRALPGVTLISRRASQPQHENSSYGSIDPVYRPLPETGTSSLHLEVTGIEYRPRVGTYALSLLLNDPEGILESERLEYLKRLNRPAEPGRFDPHVTLFDLPPHYADESVLEWAQSHQPATISLQGINTVPHITSPLRYSQEPIKIPSTMKTSSLPPPVIRRLGEGAIPQDLFNKMKPAKPAQE